MKDLKSAKETRKADLRTPSALSDEACINIAAEVNALLADTFAIYMKTKNFHWHMSGPHFRDYHLMLDEQGDQLFAMADPIAERVRKVGGTTLRSTGHAARLQRLSDNDADFVTGIGRDGNSLRGSKCRCANTRTTPSPLNARAACPAWQTSPCRSRRCPARTG